ncbi:hypothetical protein JB92DRAFT_2826281 [Gautieria morchelliformis]|nr:hypothetical protein JB92DRAFT_2826281 [Gautieria morchelliformis]
MSASHWWIDNSNQIPMARTTVKTFSVGCSHECQNFSVSRTLMVAGHETTATTISWALYCLSIHPMVQNELRQEIKVTHLQAVQRGDAAAMDLDSTRLLGAVLKVHSVVLDCETLRFHPILPQMQHIAGCDAAIPLSTPLWMKMDCSWHGERMQTYGGPNDSLRRHITENEKTAVGISANMYRLSENDHFFYTPNQFFALGLLSAVVDIPALGLRVRVRVGGAVCWGEGKVLVTRCRVGGGRRTGAAPCPSLHPHPPPPCGRSRTAPSPPPSHSISPPPLPTLTYPTRPTLPSHQPFSLPLPEPSPPPPKCFVFVLAMIGKGGGFGNRTPGTGISMGIHGPAVASQLKQVVLLTKSGQNSKRMIEEADASEPSPSPQIVKKAQVMAPSTMVATQALPSSDTNHFWQFLVFRLRPPGSISSIQMQGLRVFSNNFLAAHSNSLKGLIFFGFFGFIFHLSQKNPQQ